MLKKTCLAAACFVLAAAATACGAGGGADAPAASPTASPRAPSPTTATPEPSPTLSGPETKQLGEKVRLDTAAVRIDSVEQRNSIKGEFGEDLKPDGDGTLWLL
ncbi:hypothetical protein GCM10025865_17550 [Paraoerskovia sediminicola]|uniref:Uncharacterized protein n=1 Tax=Paraoerskovia sediminicola TaxID=1138587 RepID=A0ABN6XC96_9CELL|nr:hypothetical protein [Paraoerskovia sediminicola]BDZ42456.1 hypothetical protein GCM10025865_17550 [Paraoerskovia sediminicola]